ncbi:MarR family winged helix-turn-helix transcriptional regulator [Ruania zhangjianzhongii]|uniref:MarR family winged helix-turn-helix transcriptional regulator n=1 Tax=Ruania zhangjianzhongii TaxID=2603206 RepID=UPI0011C7C04F|nr:MarR family transcriptional regulator [Ruania zhangjianzhongii]
MSARSAAVAWESLLRAQVHLMRQFEAAKDFRPLSSREYDVLFTLSGSGRPMRLRDLNTHVLLTQPSLSRMVDRLAAAGWVQRTVADDDGRGVVISLTPAGARLQQAIGRRHVRSIAARIDPVLTEDEQTTLAELTSRLKSAAPAPERKSDD